MSALGIGLDIEGVQQTWHIVVQCVAGTVDVAINVPRTSIIDGEQIARYVSALVTAVSTYWSAHGNGPSRLFRDSCSAHYDT